MHPFLEDWGYICIAAILCTYYVYQHFQKFMYRRSVHNATHGPRAKILDKERLRVRDAQQQQATHIQETTTPPPPQKEHSDAWAHVPSRAAVANIHVLTRRPPPCGTGG